jgi:hypothetical protein
MSASADLLVKPVRRGGRSKLLGVVTVFRTRS